MHKVRKVPIEQFYRQLVSSKMAFWGAEQQKEIADMV